MTRLPRFVCCAAFVGAFALGACSSDSTPSKSGKAADTTPDGSSQMPPTSGAGGTAGLGSGGRPSANGSGGSSGSGGSGLATGGSSGVSGVGGSASGSGGAVGSGGAAGSGMPRDGGVQDATRDTGGTAPDTVGAGAKIATSKLIATGEAGFATIAGTATFTQVGNEVTLVIEVENCPKGPHATHLHENPSCANGGNAAGNHWTNGEGLGEIQCGASPKTLFEFKRSTTKWTVGGPAATDITKHSLMVHRGGDAAPGDRVACGTIVAQ